MWPRSFTYVDSTRQGVADPETLLSVNDGGDTSRPSIGRLLMSTTSLAPGVTLDWENNGTWLTYTMTVNQPVW